MPSEVPRIVTIFSRAQGFIARSIPRRLDLALVTCALVLLLGASAPTIVSVRVPAAKVGGMFPAGTQLRGTTVEELETLVKAASKGVERRSQDTPPRLLKAKHVARWESGVLIGRSELLVSNEGSRPAELLLAPWTPAIAPGDRASNRLRMSDQGRTALLVEPSASTVTAAWQLRARPSSSGKGFSLGLPATETASLELELPAGWVPQGVDGIRQGPTDVPNSENKLWRFDGKGGQVNLVLSDRRDKGAPAMDTTAWVSGPTRIDLAEASGNWITDWTVQLDPRGPRRLQVELDPGLEFLEVSGPGIESSRAEVVGESTRVTVQFQPKLSGATRVLFRALATVPTDGLWSIPAIRPLDALWTGGKTSVKLDGSRLLSDCREQAGRRVAQERKEVNESNLLVFEADAPRSVAVLQFSRPRADASVEVLGQLQLGNSAPRFEARCIWHLERGVLLGLDVDLPPTWVPERVQFEGMAAAPVWHFESRPGGEVRVHVLPPSGDLSRSDLVLIVAATATFPGGRGPMSLPRVRPVGARITDERWVAKTEAGLTLQPTAARGLAWIDPRSVIGGSESEKAFSTFHEALAWRWISERGEARVERERVESESTGSVRLIANLDRDRLSLEWKIRVQKPQNSLRSLLLAVSEPIAPMSAWRFTDEANGLEVGCRALGHAKRAALTLPETAEAWELTLPHPTKGPVSITGRLDIPWTGQGGIPLVTLADHFQCRNLVLIQESREVQSSAVSEGLERLDPSMTAQAFEASGELSDDLASDQTRRRPVHAFSYARLGGRLSIRSERLDPASGEGVIDRAVLTTFVDPVGPSRHCLSLRVAASSGRFLNLSLPAGATLLRVRRDGQSLTPIQSEGGISLPLSGSLLSRGISTIALDYQTPRRTAGSDRLLEPERPTASMPYLRFCWEIVVPRAWQVEAVPGSLATADPQGAASWFSRILGSWWTDWDPRRDRPSPVAKEIFDAFDQRVHASRLEEISLGELLLRLDVGPWPIVVDSMALEGAGLGPKSKFTVPDTKVRNSARSLLGSLGVALIPVGEMVLATTRAESPERQGGAFRLPDGRDEWSLQMRAASAWGSDSSDRLQSVARWLGEASPKSRNSGGLSDFETLREGWNIWRFSTLGWPEKGLSVRLFDGRVHAAWRWGAMLGVIFVGVLGRSLPRRLRIVGLAALLGSAVLIQSMLWERRFEATAPGVIVGSVAVLFYWVGRSWRGTDTNGGRGSYSSSLIRVPAVAAPLLAAIAGLGVLGYLGQVARAQVGAERSILVLFPFDGEPDPARKPDRAIMRLADYEHLKSLAESHDSIATSALAALSATHRISGKPDRQLTVETEMELVSSQEGTSFWTFPVGNSRDILATLDGTSVPVQIRDSGRSAVVAIAGSGNHRLSLKRIVVPRQSEEGERLSLPINPIAAAHAVIHIDSGSGAVDLPTARGRVAPQGSSVEGDLGPIDRLEIHWPSQRGITRPAPTGSVDGLLLWDADQAGDHVRARLTYRNPAGTSLIRLRLQPGLAIRPVAIPGLLDSTWQGTPERPEWVASVDPPLPDGASIQLEFWRPRDSSKGNMDAPARRLPVIEPIGVERYAGSLGFRRPADWSGRLSTLSGGESVTEEVFVRAWGNLPEEPLTLSGVTRFSRAPELSIAAGPPRDQATVQPEVHLTLGPGRIGVDIKVDLRESSTRTSRLAFEVPPAFRVTGISGDGLSDWTREADKIRLCFDGVSLKQRTIRVRGWLAVLTDPLSTIATNQEIAVPWPRWIDVQARPGTLTVEGITPFQLVTEAGVETPSSETADAKSTSGIRYRKVYSVVRGEGLGKLRWEIEPARVGVQVRSQVTIHPDWAEWVAIVRYDVSGGACDVVHLKLPSAWAASAEISFIGDTHQLTAEARGTTTFWAIRPERPIWGSRELVVRAIRPVIPGEALVFPDLNPLGRGSVDTYLALTNASGREIATEGSPGVQQVDDRNRFLEEVFTTLPGLQESVFHVRSSAWTLKVIASKDSRTSGSDTRPANVALADMECELLRDGAILGLVRYEVEPRSGTFLPVELPPGAEPLWTSVNHVSERPLRSSSGQWVIPINEETATHVSLIWRALPRVDPAQKTRAITFPSLMQARVPTLLSVRTPASVKLTAVNRQLAPVSLDRLDTCLLYTYTERAEWLSRAIREELGKIDRGSLRDRARLMSALVRFELILRSADRAATWDPTHSSQQQEEWAENLRHRLRLIRSTLLEPIENAGLDEFARRVQAHLGNVPEVSENPVAEIPEPEAPVRLQRAGVPHFFFVDSTSADRPSLRLQLSVDVHEAESLSTDDDGSLLAAIIAPFMVWGLLSDRFRSRMFNRLATLAVLLAVGLAAGPLLFVGALVMAALGRFC